MENSVTKGNELTTGDETLTRLVGWFDAAEEATIDARKASERARDYFDSKQLTTEEIAELKKRGQPPLVINRIKRKIEFMTGLEKQTRTDPKARPRNPDDDEAAEAATDSIRFVTENSDWDVARSDAWENKLVEGACGVEVTIKFQGDEPVIQLVQVPWDRLFADPHSSKKDYSDARYNGIVIWKDRDEAEERWPDAKEAFEANLTAVTTDTFEDKPKHTVWADAKRQRVRIVQMYYKDGGVWHWAQFTKGTMLAGGKSPYLDENGEPENPLNMDSAYVDRDNNRYGAVKDMIDIQDEINKRRSKALHLITMRQTKGVKGAVDDVRKMKTELAKPDGHVEVNPGMDFEVLDNNDMTSFQFALLQESKQEIDLMGPNAALTGKSGKSESGRAIQAQQQGGVVELATLNDGHKQFGLRVYRQIWNRVRQFWTKEKWIRVTDNEQNAKFVGLNQPVTQAEAAIEKVADSGMDEERLQAVTQQLQALPGADEPFVKDGQPVLRNRVAEMDVDIIVEDAPDTVTLQQEQFESLIRLVEAGYPIPPQVVIQASNLSAANKRAVLKALEGGDEERDPQAEEMQQAAIELEFGQKAADINKTEAETRDKLASAAQRVASAVSGPTTIQ